MSLTSLLASHKHHHQSRHSLPHEVQSSSHVERLPHLKTLSLKGASPTMNRLRLLRQQIPASSQRWVTPDGEGTTWMHCLSRLVDVCVLLEVKGQGLMGKACGIKELPSDIWHPLLFSSLNQHKHTHTQPESGGGGMLQYGTWGINCIGVAVHVAHVLCGDKVRGLKKV